MKMVLGEYGKVIILAVVLCGLLGFLFSRDAAGYIGLVSGAVPKQSLDQGDTFALAESILSRKSPVLSVTVKKLQKGESVDLLDREKFQIIAKNEEDKYVKLSVIKIMDTKGKDIVSEVDPKCFVPLERGAYHVTYKAEEEFYGSEKITEKEYCFLAD